MKFRYKSGEQIKKGDRVLFHGESGDIEFVAEEQTGDPAMDWYIGEFGGGVMIREPKVFGHCFLQNAGDSDWEDLEFVSRA